MGKGMHAHLAPTQCMKSTKARVWAVQMTEGAYKTGGSVRTWAQMWAGWGKFRIPSVLHRRCRLEAVLICSACWACCLSAALLRQAALCRRCALCMGGRPWWQPLVLRSAMQLRRFGCPGQHPSGHVSGIA